MTVITVSDNVPIRNWETDSTNADLVVDGVTLRGTAAAAYLFGQALGTIKYQGLLDGVQLTDGTFEFPPGSNQWVSLPEVADALHFKYGIDPLIEFAPGLGLRGYSVADINRILLLLNSEYDGQFSLPMLNSTTVQGATQATFDAEKAAAGSGATYDATAVTTLLDTASTANMTPATEAELRQNFTEGGDLYVDRAGNFYVNGVRTTAMDVAVVSRLLVQDNISSEYKLLMDEYAERNNMISAARTVIGGGREELPRTTSSLAQLYGMDDVLSELTAGQYSDAMMYLSTNASANTVTFGVDPQWATGTRVQVGVSAGGLTAGTNYYVRSLGGGTYSFYTDRAAALAPNASALVDLTDKVWNDVFAPDAVPKELAGSVADVVLTPGNIPGNLLKTYDVLANATFHEIGGDDDKKWLTFGPIDPDWAEDTALEFTNAWGDVKAGEQNYVTRLYSTDNAMPNVYNDHKGLWQQQPNGPFIGYQLTPNASGTNGDAFDTSNRATNKPTGSVALYDADENNAGEMTYRGYTQFSLPGTDFATETKFQPNEDVNLLVTHSIAGQVFYKSIVALHKGRDYYLRNLGNGEYSVYDTPEHAKAGGDSGKLYFAIDEKADFTGTGTRSPWITDQTATVWGIARGITIPDAGKTAMKFAQDPGWATGTAVQTRSSGGGLTAGETYYVRRNSDASYGFFTTEGGALTGAGSPVALFEPFAGDVFLANEKDLDPFDAAAFNDLTAILNTLISNKVRDGDLDQAKLQTLTAQLQNNTEAMTALIKVLADLNASLAQALR